MCLYRGNIFNNSTKKYLKSMIKLLDSSWIDEILKLQKINYEFIFDKNLYVPITREELIDVFDLKGYVLGVIVGKKLVGFRILSFYDEETIRVAKKAGIKDPYKVIFFESTLVDYNYIGNGLQKKMINLTLEKIIDKSIFEYGISTVSPKNIPSIKSLLNTGFYIKNSIIMYGGKDRFICVIDLFEKNSEIINDSIRVYIYDFKKQNELFDLNYKIVNIDGDKYIFVK